MDVVSGVWKRAGIDKGQLAKCVAGVVPEAAEHRGESYIAIKIHMDIRKGGEIAVATLELDGRLSSSEGRATWPQIHSPTAKCVDAVLSPARLHMEAAPVTATLAVEVAKYENEPIPDFLLPRKTGTGAVPAGVAVPEESRKGSWRQSERDSGGNPRVAVPEES